MEQIGKATGCHQHGLRTLLDALCPIGLLQQAEGRYELTPTAEAYLVRGSPAYCMPIYLAWLQNRARFIEFVRTGRAGHRSDRAGGRSFVGCLCGSRTPAVARV